MNRLVLILTVIAATGCAAEDYGDAPASYGLPYVLDEQHGFLGHGASPDGQNPVTPAWTGDQDDAIVGTPYWDSWSLNNTLTVHLSDISWLLLWVDADDSGTFDSNELYEIMPGYMLPGPGDYTFENIRINATQDFSRNGPNKVAIRIYAQNNIGGGPRKQPDAWCYFGEIEDWLIDVEPAKFAVHHESLREATETYAYNSPIFTVNGAGGNNWTMTGGALPQGMTLTQQGEDFVLAGTPPVGAAGDYTFTIEATDSASNVATRTLTLEVTPKPFPMPFLETFSTNNFWKIDPEFAITQATGYVSAGTSGLGYVGSEPTHDFSPGNSDDLMLLSTPNGEEPFTRVKPIFAVSPKIDCSGASQVEVRFRRWYSAVLPGYNLGASNNVRLEITSDGVNWDVLWVPPYHQGQVADIAWSMVSVDATPFAVNRSWLRLRFRIGEHVINPPAIFTWANVGWGIDDLEVRAPRLSTPLSAHDMELQSPAQFQNPTNSQWYPLLYPQYAHPWQVLVDNPTAHDVTIDTIEGTSFIEVLPGANNWWNGPPYFMAEDCWHDWGDWTLDQPVTIPAGAANVPVTGKFHFDSVFNQYLLTPWRAALYLRGAQATTGADVELFADDLYTPNWQSMPGVYVFENQVSGTQVMNGAASANSRNFGSRAVGTASPWLYIMIENTTTNDMPVGIPQLTGPDAGDFILYTASITNPIPANDWSYFTIKFRPNTTGLKTASVEFTHPAPNTGSPFVFEVSGFGSANAPIVMVRETDANGQVIANASAPSGQRNFGQVDLGAAPTASRSIHIENMGSQPLQLGTPVLTGPDAAEFSLNTAAVPASLLPGAATTFEYQFNPATIGAKSATIEFTHNDTGTSTPFTIPLAGEGINLAPVIVVAEGSAYGAIIQPGDSAAQGRLFGSVGIGSGATAYIQIFIRNDGLSPLTLGTPTLAGANAGDFLLDTSSLSQSVASHAVTWFGVAFDPNAKGIKSAWVSISHDDPVVPDPFEFEVVGIGEMPNGVIIVTQTLPEGRVDVDYTAQLVAAQGAMPYTWTSITAMPAGLTLSSDGQVAGKPSGASGVFDVVVQVRDTNGGTESRQVRLIIQPRPGFPRSTGSNSRGGCTTGQGNWYWLLALGALAVLCRLRTRRAT